MTDAPRSCFDRPAFTSRVVPVIVLTDAAQAVPLAHALLEGGVDVMEITLRHGSALAAIEAVAIDLGLGVRFVAFEADQDGDLHRRLAERIAVESELVEPTVDTVLGAVGRASAVFTMRYHGAIAALRRGRPAILVDYSPKMADLSADLAQAMPALPVGLPDAGTAVEAMNRAVSRAGDLPGHLDRLVTREAANAATLEALVATDGG